MRTRWLPHIRGAMLAAGIAASALTSLEAQQVQSAIPPGPPSNSEVRRSFEVASVKPNTASDNRTMIGFQPGGRYVATGAPLRFIVRTAFRVQDSQLVGLPDWTRSERFDITAKAEDQNATPAMISEMMQTLLMERFSLVTHRETRELPVYDLVLARADGRLGPELKASTTDCEAMRAARGRGGPPEGGRMTMPLGRGGPGTAPGAAPGARGTALGAVPPCAMRMMPGNFTASGGTLNQLAETLSAPVGRIVRNKTGLNGGYDFSVTFTPDQMAGGRGPDAPPPDAGGAPSLFTALQEQLGLKLESARAPVDVVVVDKVERPTPD